MEKAPETDDDFKVPAVTLNFKVVKKPDINSESELSCKNITCEKDVLKNVQASAETMALPYKDPVWAGIPTDEYSFEVIKTGKIISNICLNQSRVVIGRLMNCNIVLKHPTSSRYHAILQYRTETESNSKGYYIYDLESTHGTFLNKEKIIPKTYYLMKNGYILKFGDSTRLYLFNAPENEGDLAKKEVTDAPNVEEICSWGIGEDAEEEEEKNSDLSVNPFAVCLENEDLYINDPKKTLRGWFEREGYELEYNVEERGFKTFCCSVKLPIDTPTSEYLTVEASVQGKKKEAVVACALEACRTLDRHGLLCQSHQSSRERKRKNWEDEDFYDSDEDTYLDRTGTIEKKRQARMMQVKKPEPETFASLEKKLMQLNEQISGVQTKLQSDVSSCSSGVNQTEDDPLDSYMSEINNESIDKVMKSKLKLELSELLQERAKLENLLNIAKPTKLPIKKFPIIGKKLKSKLKLPSPKPKDKNELKDSDPEVEEDEDEKEEEKHIEVPEKQKERNIEMSEEKSVSSSTHKNMIDKNRNVEKIVSSEDIIAQDLTAGAILSKQPKFSMSCSNKKKDVKKARTEALNKNVNETSDENYSMWMPPTNQTGDGSTHLNLKYGY